MTKRSAIAVEPRHRMRKLTPIAGSAIFLVIAPGIVSGLVPWRMNAGPTDAH